jgi:hypothetical protein
MVVLKRDNMYLGKTDTMVANPKSARILSMNAAVVMTSTMPIYNIVDFDTEILLLNTLEATEVDNELRSKKKQLLNIMLQQKTLTKEVKELEQRLEILDVDLTEDIYV